LARFIHNCSKLQQPDKQLLCYTGLKRTSKDVYQYREKTQTIGPQAHRRIETLQTCFTPIRLPQLQN
jgi:hypothetical protein